MQVACFQVFPKLHEFFPDVSMQSDKTRGSVNDRFMVIYNRVCLAGFDMILFVFYSKVMFHLSCIKHLASLIIVLFRQKPDMNIRYREFRM